MYTREFRNTKSSQEPSSVYEIQADYGEENGTAIVYSTSDKDHAIGMYRLLVESGSTIGLDMDEQWYSKLVGASLVASTTYKKDTVDIIPIGDKVEIRQELESCDLVKADLV